MDRQSTKFTSNLKRAGAAIDDTIELLRHWTDEIPDLEMRNKLIKENVLGKKSYRRRKDFTEFIFLPRYVRGYPEKHWIYLQQLVMEAVPQKFIKQLLYFYTALNEPFVPLIIKEFILPHYQDGQIEFTSKDVKSLILRKIKDGIIDVDWTDSVLDGVVQGLLNVLTEFGILKGKVNRVIQPDLIHLPVFYYIVFFIHSEGYGGKAILEHEYWNLFLLNDIELKHLITEAHLNKYLYYEETGSIVNINFKENTFEEVVNVIVERTT